MYMRLSIGIGTFIENVPMPIERRIYMEGLFVDSRILYMRSTCLYAGRVRDQAGSASCWALASIIGVPDPKRAFSHVNDGRLTGVPCSQINRTF